MKEALHVGDAEDIFGAYVASELRSLDASSQRIGKIEITNTLNRLETSQFCGNVSSESSADIQPQYSNNTNGSAATPLSGSWMRSYTNFLNY